MKNRDRGPKIVYLCPVGEIGGAEISMLDLVSRMKRDGFRITAILLNGGPLEQKLKDLDVPCDILPLPQPIRALSRAGRPSPRQYLALPFLLIPFALRLRKRIVRERPDAVISNGIKCHVLSPLSTFLTGAGLIWHVRDMLAPGFLRWWLRVTAGLFCRLVITNSRAVAETIPTRHTVTIYNGIDLEIFRSDLAPLDRERDLHLPPGSRVIGTICHLAPIKGLETLIDAVPTILSRVPRAQFLIAGDAIYETHRPYERRLKDKVRQMGLDDRIHFLGFSADVPRLLAAFDLFVLSSHSEGFGRVVVEALAVGCPVVSTAVGGVPEIICNETHGLLVPPGDPEALAGSVIRLMGDPALRERLADRGRRRVREHFALPKQASAFRSAVLSVLSDTGREASEPARAAAFSPGDRA